MSLYHRDVFMPDCIDAYCSKVFTLDWSRHAMRACLDDKNGVIYKPPTSIIFSRCDVVEFECPCPTSDVAIKLVVRQKYDVHRDLVLVLLLPFIVAKPKVLKVKTVWTNKITDSHITLDKSRYATR